MSPLPRYIDAREAEPMLTSAANADITIISGRHTPMPVSASLPVPSMCPMYMRSTRLYSMFIICAVIAGRDSLSSSLPTLSVPSRSVSLACKFLSSLT